MGDDCFDHKVGDIVTRGGDDLHVVLSVDGDITGCFQCIYAPWDGWCKLGDCEHNLLRRYTPVPHDQIIFFLTKMAEFRAEHGDTPPWLK